MIAVALLLQNEPLLLTCSSRANTCEPMRQIVEERASRCRVKIEFRNYTAGPIIVTADGAILEVVSVGKATAKQRTCIAEAVKAAEDRYYPAKSGSKN